MKKHVKATALILCGLMMLETLLAGCGGSNASSAAPAAPAESGPQAESVAPPEEKRPVVGVSLFYRRDEYYKDLDAGFQKEAAAAGMDLIIQDADSDVAKQTQQLEDFVQKGVDAIALAACDPDGIVPAIEAAVEAGIPVITYDGDANTDKKSTFVGFDFHEDGVMVGEWAAKYINDKLGGTAKCAVIDFPQSPIVCGLRAQGFIDGVTAGTKAEIVAQQDGKATRSDSMNVMENILTAHPDVQVVYGINFDTCAGAKAAIEAAGRDDIIVVGNGYGEEEFKALAGNDPILKAFATSMPQIQARDTIAAVQKLLAGEEVPKETISHSTLYDADNIGTLDWEAIIAERSK